MKMVSARQIVGRRIIGFEPRPFDASSSEMPRPHAHAPIIILDDGSTLYFLVEETESGEYGIYIGRAIPKRKGHPK